MVMMDLVLIPTALISRLSSKRLSEHQLTAEYRFPPTLTNHERALVHSECKAYGIISKSYGKGDARALCMSKRTKRKGPLQAFQLRLGKETHSRVEKYLRSFPPTKKEIESLIEECGRTAGEGNVLSKSYSTGNHEEQETNAGAKRTRKRAKELQSDEIIRRRTKWKEFQKTKKGKKLLNEREKLPIREHRDEILRCIASNQVVLIAGETGCGKTTQVPQYLLENCWESEKPCRIMCTQPRRLSATSVSERIAAERGEDIGENVGYTIRLDHKGGDDCSIMFCTNGIMLRMLTSEDTSLLSSITHIVIDEIHERDRFADFMLIIIRDLLPRYTNLRVVLMSATLHEELFSSYFGVCPIVRVSGFTYPVQDFYLEDVLRVTGYQDAALRQMNVELKSPAADITRKKTCLSSERQNCIFDAIEGAFKVGGDQEFSKLVELTGAADSHSMTDDAAPGINLQHPETGATALLAASFHGRGDIASTLLANGANVSIKAENGMDAAECASEFGHTELAELLRRHAKHSAGLSDIEHTALAISHYQSTTDVEEVDLGLIEELLKFICGSGSQSSLHDIPQASQEANAILVFLPGWDEIIRLKEKLENSAVFGNRSAYLILPLHSMVAPAEQRKVFLTPPSSIRKIILSTNIAETAITINDVVCVIDSGRQKEKSFDPYTGVSTLQSGWISKASARQRRGRAGRCRPGVAYHMYSRQRSESLEEYQLPEIMRTPLEEMCLQVKLLEKNGNISIADFLGKAVEPPVQQAIQSSINLLENIGAIEEKTENLTVLGKHLASLPISPTLGKMLIYGVMFECLDPILTVACCMGYRDPWVLPPTVDGKRQASQCRQRFSSMGSGASDQLAVVVAFNEWKKNREVWVALLSITIWDIRLIDAFNFQMNHFCYAERARMVVLQSQLLEQLDHDDD